MGVRTVESDAASADLLSLDELRAQLRAVGEERYHHQHPFHLMMHEGRLSRGQLQAWALNRSTTRASFQSRTRLFCRAGWIRRFGGRGASGWWIMTGMDENN